MSNEWYCQLLGQELGPMGADELRALVANHQLLPDDYIKRGDTGEWTRAADTAALASAFASSPSGPAADSHAPSEKSDPAECTFRFAKPSAAALRVVGAFTAGAICVLLLVSRFGPSTPKQDAQLAVQRAADAVKPTTSPNAAQASAPPDQLPEVSLEPSVGDDIPPNPDEAEPPAPIESEDEAKPDNEMQPALEPEPVGPETESPAHSEASLADLIEQVERSVVRIETVLDGDAVTVGSGFVAADNVVVTNLHVVAGAKSIRVISNTGQEATAEAVLAIEPGKDLAVLQCEPFPEPLAPLPLNARAIRKGEAVVAFGCPIGLSFASTEGIVSAIRSGEEIQREAAALQYKFDADAIWIQSTAALSHGNSGGPLVNRWGQVVGVNTWTAPAGNNLSFALRAQHVAEVLAQLDHPPIALADLPKPDDLPLPKPAMPPQPQVLPAVGANVVGAMRLKLLEQIYQQRLVLLARRERLLSTIEGLHSQRAPLQAALVGANVQARSTVDGIGTLQGEIAELQQQKSFVFNNRLALLGIDQAIEQRLSEIRSLEQQLGSIKAQAAQAAVAYSAVDRQLEGAEWQMRLLRDQADQLRIEWLRLADPFGRLARAEHEAALVVFSEWIVLDGENPFSFLARGLALRRLGRLDEALADFDRALELLGAGDFTALMCRAWLLHSLDRKQEAIVQFNRILKADKTNAMARILRGMTYVTDKKYRAAETDFKAAANLRPNDWEPHRQLALVYSAYGSPGLRNGKRAIKSALRACELSERQDWQCLAALGAAYAEAGQFDDATKTISEAAKLADGENKELCVQWERQFAQQNSIELD